MYHQWYNMTDKGKELKYTAVLFSRVANDYLCFFLTWRRWLINHFVNFDEKLSRKELWNLITLFGTNGGQRYVTDETLREHGHEVLRLPPYLPLSIQSYWNGVSR